MQIGALDFVPYVLRAACVEAREGLRLSRQIAALPGTRFLDVLDEKSAPFFRLLNAANALAFGPLAMPAWVQLDCATLPSAMIGFALRRRDVPAGLWSRLAEQAPGPASGLGADALVPVSAFCAVPSGASGRVVAFTLFSLVPGLDLGLRTKALGLLILGARRQVGVTRRSGPVRALHEHFGPLEILHDRPSVHPEAADTFVYELRVPRPAFLQDLVLRGRGTSGTGP